MLAWWEFKNTQFQEVVFVTTIFEYRNVLSPSLSKHSRACHFENSSRGQTIDSQSIISPTYVVELHVHALEPLTPIDSQI
jgi:hypothetical protein